MVLKIDKDQAYLSLSAKQMKTGIVTCSILCASLLLCGCAAVIIGAGAAGAGAFAFAEGKLIRTYAYGYQDTVQASLDTLESLKIPVEKKIADELKTSIYAIRPDGTPVTVEVLRATAGNTKVAIRTGKIGVFDKKTSYQIHEFILDRLNKIAIILPPSEDTRTKTPVATETDTGEPASQSGEMPEINYKKSEHVTVYFDVNTNSLSGKESDKLDIIIDNVKNYPNSKIAIIGYSDASGSPLYNKSLSLKRAETVQMYMVGKGVPLGQTEIFGRGSLFFVGDNATEEGRRLNRRVEIYIKRKK